ncbi:hypothetical protein [Lactococcus ileimucosae]|uniref:hypothetical protein n=1 Tax=Lactococcus ileimucosae TaxID=2941329 RepID=UPI0020437B50|nr:hypothetical protein [Lactococcus ileimucosae]
MTPEKKNQRRLRNLALLSLLLLLVGGTFAFQAFNQRAINDRLRENIPGGRVHDYYNRDTENKDVFVENYGNVPLMARIRLSEFMEKRSAGDTDFTPIVNGTIRDQVNTWTVMGPSETNLNTRVGDSAAFNTYANLTFGWSRSGQDAPWFMPTFNRDNSDLMTASAGHARDWVTSTATDGVTDGATHPGDGTDAYWSSGDSFDNSGSVWPGEEVTHDAAQNLQQDRAPMTISQWAALPNNLKVGNFWVIDHQTGWAYWANQLQAGETTSYLLDAAQMTAAADNIPGEYYYGIHVDGQLISPDRINDFLAADPDYTHHADLSDFLTAVQNGSIDNNWGNPGPDDNVQPDQINFSIMAPGTIFTMAGEQYRYLENMGNNHMIIRNEMIPNITFNGQNNALNSWYGALDPAVQAMVQPVSDTFNTGNVGEGELIWRPGGGYEEATWRWIPVNLSDFSDVAADITEVNSSGSPRAFALSLADVVRLSGPGRAFPSSAERVAGNAGENNDWFTRTPGVAGGNGAWRVFAASETVYSGGLHGSGNINWTTDARGVRPALIVNQSN